MIINYNNDIIENYILSLFFTNFNKNYTFYIIQEVYLSKLFKTTVSFFSLFQCAPIFYQMNFVKQHSSKVFGVEDDFNN